MSGRATIGWAAVLGLGLCWVGCAGAGGGRGAEGTRTLRFPAARVVGDLELSRMNDEELFAGGTSAFAASDHAQAARFFGRLADFFPESPHRRAALYNAGLAEEKLERWADALARFEALADPDRGVKDALDASFRMAETLYHLERYAEAAALLQRIAGRTDLEPAQRLEAQVQQGVCELEQGLSQQAEGTLRRALATYAELSDPTEVSDYFPAQAQFFLGEIYRLHYESVTLEPDKTADDLSKDLEYKAELLLSSQGHYLRAIRIGNGYWATAAGAQIGGLYESLYEHMVNAPTPRELQPEEGDLYRLELRKKIRVLITKAINVYERTLEAAERIGASSPFVERTRESLRKMKDLLVAGAASEDPDSAAPSPPPEPEGPPDAAPAPDASPEPRS